MNKTQTSRDALQSEESNGANEKKSSSSTPFKSQKPEFALKSPLAAPEPSLSIRLSALSQPEMILFGDDAAKQLSEQSWHRIQEREQLQDQYDLRASQQPQQPMQSPSYKPSIQQSTPKVLSASRYLASPATEVESPLGWAQKIAAVHQVGHQIVKIVDPFSQVGLRDYGFLETWTENLKSILGKHVYRTVNRFDVLASAIAQQLFAMARQRAPTVVLDAREVQAILSLRTHNPQLLETYLATAREWRILELSEYNSISSIFCVPGSSTGLSNSSPDYVQRVHQLSQCHHHHLRIETDTSSDMSSSFSSSSSFGSPYRRQQQYTPQRGQPQTSSSDADIVLGIFFHLCDNLMGHRRFSHDHYVDGISNIPQQSIHGGAQVGVVRATGLVEAGMNVRNTTMTYAVFTVSNVVGLVPPSPEVVRGTGRSGSIGGGGHEHPHRTNRELLVVEAGRNNCFEAIILFLIQLVRHQQIQIIDDERVSRSGDGLFGLVLDVFNCTSGADLLVTLKDLGVLA